MLITSFSRRLWFWLRRRKLESDFEEEMRQHLELKIRENIACGMTGEAAHHMAHLEFGNPVLTKEHSRQNWGFPILESILQDVRYAVRQLRKNPGFTSIAVLTLALGIGANSAIFSVINAVLLRPFLFHDADRLLMIWQKDPKTAGEEVHISGPDYFDWSEQNNVLSGMAAYPETESFELIKNQQATEVPGLLATANLLTVVGVQPVRGRSFTQEEEKAHARVALISQGFWHEYFAGDQGVLGRTITLNAEPYKVIGILPSGFRLPWVGEFNVLAPLPLDAGVMRNRESHRLHVIARMLPGVTLTQAEADFKLVDGRISNQRRDSEKNLVIRFGTLLEDNREIRFALLVLMGAVGFVLLIACGNVANLLLSRGVGRRKEFAIRCAIGASLARVIRQLATESLLLGLAGCGLGVLLAACCTPYFAGQATQHFRNISGISIDLRVTAFAILISLLTTVLFSLVPVAASARPDVNRELKEGSSARSSSSSGHQKFRGLLVSGEVALALIVLIGAGLLIRDFLKRASVNPGIRTDHVLTAEVHLKGSTYQNPTFMRAYYAQALQNLATIPAVTQVSASSALSLGNGEIMFMGFAIPGSPLQNGGEQPALVRLITSGYFDVLGAPVLGGRDFTQADTATSERVAIVNQTFVQRYFQGQDAIGKSVELTDKLNFHRVQPGLVRIVGIAPAIQHWCIGCEPHSDAEIYVPFTQSPAPDMILLLQYHRDFGDAATAVRRQIEAVDSTQAVYGLKSMSEQLSNAVRPFLFYPSLLTVFGLIALVLACTGVYAVLSYSVTERRHEMGIRMALGATKQDITRIVLGRSGKLVSVGLAAGIVSALGLTRFLSHLLKDVSSFDPLTFAVISAVLVFVAAVASFLPAYRASKIDPMVALRVE